MKQERKSKPIPFTENEFDLLQWAENQGKPFATYVKDLIRQDMKKHSTYKKEDLKDLIKEILDEMNIKNNTNIRSNTIDNIKKEPALGTKGKKAYKNILGDIGRS
ncbi:hypothetical protein DP124_12160 [Clostridium tetani]|uniref:hypothetical protein n=1 Tax=Clostridium tetani TaxID=1513 RepID=UPI00100B4E02|nr:hypothetical protein [Clostridium tetani]RXI50217.1 hypothetical protein DP124_12160 [Clostridium tetani]